MGIGRKPDYFDELHMFPPSLYAFDRPLYPTFKIFLKNYNIDIDCKRTEYIAKVFRPSWSYFHQQTVMHHNSQKLNE